MVKIGYYGNEDLDLVWARVKVHQMTLFTTTAASSALSERNGSRIKRLKTTKRSTLKSESDALKALIKISKDGS